MHWTKACKLVFESFSPKIYYYLNIDNKYMYFNSEQDALNWKLDKNYVFSFSIYPTNLHTKNKFIEVLEILSKQDEEIIDSTVLTNT